MDARAAAYARETEREARAWAKAETAKRRRRAVRHASASERRLFLVLLAGLRRAEGGAQ